MNNNLKKLNVKIITILSILIFIISFCPSLINKGVVFADSIQDNPFNSMSVDEIAQMEKFSSRDYGVVTPNLDQGSTQICWAYAVASASETSILKDNLDENTKDTLHFSPTQIAYRTYNRDADPLGNTVGVYDNDSWNVTGNSYNTFLMLSQWCAPVDLRVSMKSNAYESNLYRLLDAEKLDLNLYSQEYRKNKIKSVIAKYGAVTGSYYNAREVEFYNTKNETSSNGIAHAMTIVGWDDTIPASKFQPGTASQNGGWLIKNSYNSLPYFYLSYDSPISNICAFKYANKSEYDFNYFYDNESKAPMRSDNNSKCVSNIFQAKKSDDTHNEYVKAVNVATYGDNLTCTVKVYTNLTDPKAPESGTLSASGERVLDYEGYHTIMLNNLAKIDKGTYYSVVVNVSSNSGGSAYILYSRNSNGNTYYKSSYGWNSINYSGRIKAYTVLQEKGETEQKVNLSLASYDEITPLSFTGYEICPQVNLTYNSQSLVKDRDYTVIYKNNINVGVAEIIINGIGNYTGSINLQFEILPVDVPTRPNSEIKFSSNATTLSDISLPAGWQWQDPSLEVNNLTSATAIYVGENKENYKNTILTISLQKEESTPNNPNDNNQNKDKDNQDDILKTIILVVVGSIILVTPLIIITIKKKKNLK